MHEDWVSFGINSNLFSVGCLLTFRVIVREIVITVDVAKSFSIVIDALLDIVVNVTVETCSILGFFFNNYFLERNRFMPSGVVLKRRRCMLIHTRDYWILVVHTIVSLN